LLPFGVARIAKGALDVLRSLRLETIAFVFSHARKGALMSGVHRLFTGNGHDATQKRRRDIRLDFNLHRAVGERGFGVGVAAAELALFPTGGADTCKRFVNGRELFVSRWRGDGFATATAQK